MTEFAPKDTAAGSQGSAQVGVKAPESARDRRWLWIVLAAVIALLLLAWLIPSAVTATGMAPPDVTIADTETVLPPS